MKKRITSWLLMLILVLGLLPAVVSAAPKSGGSGTEADPYLIATAEDLAAFRDEVNASADKSTSTLCAKLTANIDLGKQEGNWTPIGRMTNTYSSYVGYAGTFDGNGFTISGLNIEAATQYQGLFGYVKGGIVKNLTVEGSVKTTTTSSAYAAGIVSYGYPATLENCTNKVNVTAEKKGYIGGVASYLASGSSVSGCTNLGEINSCGGYSAGIAGTANATTIKNCFNSGKITDTAASASYPYCIGGVIGNMDGKSSMERCGNTGAVTSSLKRTGGVVGSAGGSISSCFNTGAVNGIWGTGGIAGGFYGKDVTITDCYNLGDVTGNLPGGSGFKDTNSKGIGGIVGDPSSTSNSGIVLKNCYNAGTIVNNDDTTEGITVGGVIGNSTTINYSGVVSANMITAENCYYLAADGLNGDGANASAAGVTAKTEAELKTSAFAEVLGGSYVAQADSYPLLGWQDPNAVYTVRFQLSPANAILVVKQGENVLAPGEDGSFSLKNGDYTYEVSAPECKTVTGSFTVAYSGQTITVTLQESLYNVVFTTVPEDAVLTVDGRTPLTDGRTYLLPKSGNPYSYTLKAFGYEDKTGSFTVTGNPAEDAQNITMTALEKQTVSFGAVTAEDGAAIQPVITVTCPAWPDQKLTAETNGIYQLPAGEYHYTIACPGYKGVNGDFTVEKSPVSIPAVVLAVQTSWDGETYTEPQKDENGIYQIGSPDELMWFDVNAKMTDSAVLTADISINEDVYAEAADLYQWQPIGYYKDYNTSSKYTGTFDGDGHTIRGLYISMNTSDYTANYVGLFGYVGNGGKICNLTLTDSLIQTTGSNRGNYAGPFAGDAYDLENCHATSTVRISGRNYVGGLAGYLDHSAYRCSSAATVISEGNTVGGLFGTIQSNSSTAVSECFFSGSVTGVNLVGGIAGSLYNGGTLSDIYCTGSAEATAAAGAAGGITGTFRSGTIRNAYACGNVTAANAGSVAAKLEWTSGQKTLDNVYVIQSDRETAAVPNGCTIQNGAAVSKTAEELKGLASSLGDKFTEDAASINQGYPILNWQKGSQEVDPDQPASDPNGWNGKTSEVPAQVEGVYQISSAAELKWFADNIKKTPEIKGVLTGDIDLNYRSWTPADGSFAGELDGNQHEIKNLYCKSNETAALFRVNAGTIKNLTVSGKVIGGDGTAAIAAQNVGTISGCTAAVSVTGGNYTAGICAENHGTIIDCVNNGKIQGAQYVGGISGENKAEKGTAAEIRNCVNNGMIQAGGAMAGGIAGDNDCYVEGFAKALVSSCANSGHVVSTAAIVRSYTGGCVGRNNGRVEKLYNTGCVESMGGCVGGALGLNLSKAEKEALYNIGDVMGGDYEDDGYPTDNAISSEEELAQARKTMGEVIARLTDRDAISGELSISGKAEVEAEVKAEYSGSRTDLIYVWYYSYDENDDVVLAISSDPSYTIGQDMGGRILRVKALSAETSGVLKAESAKIIGLTGIVKIEGPAVVGRTLTASFQSADTVSGLKYQWYQGKTPIESAQSETYTVAEADAGKILTVRVTSTAVAGYAQASTATVRTPAQADMWELSECSEPALVGGVYAIQNEKELHWFASEVNGGNTGISAKLLNDIALTTDNWYPIGRSGHAFAGSFDGNGKSITNLKITSSADETGFFGLITDKGKVTGLNLSGTVTAEGDVSQTGGIAGAMADGDSAAYITDCSFSGSVNGSIQVGGIVGSVGLHNRVERCSNLASVSGTEQIGGIAGANSYGNIYYCRNTGAVGNESAKQVGGIVGDDQNYAEVFACYNTGSVTGADYVGGVAGNVYVAAMPMGCYNIGNVSTAIHCGGAVGSFGGDDYITGKTGSFYQGPLPAAYKANGAKMRTAEQMKADSFVSELNRDAYMTCYTKDSRNINNGYPVLVWENGGFLVTFNAAGGTCNTLNVIVQENGTLPQIPAAYRWNYHFDGWFTGPDDGEQITEETVFEEDTTVYAHWTINRPSTGEQDKKTVYFSLSEDGSYVTGNDADSTILAEVPMTVEWFDLAPYGLEDYTLKSNGETVKQPTVLHLMIRMLETYYLDVDETLQNGTDAMTVSGDFAHLYFQKFWGHGQNMTYFLNHAFPVMQAGIGASADYITLENGDLIEIAMYSDSGFYTNPDAGFPYFVLPDGSAAEAVDVMAGKSDTLVLRRAFMNIGTAEPVDTVAAGVKIHAVASLTDELTQENEIAVTGENGSFAYTFDEAGSYYLVAEGSHVSSPAICKVTVEVNPAMDTEKLIDAIGEVTLDSKPAIDAARIAYDALSEEQKAEVKNYSALTDAESRYADLLQEAADRAAAAKVEEMILALPAVDELQLSDGASVAAARNAYDALTEAQKGYVSEDEKYTLEAAEARIAELQAAADKEEADREAAAGVAAKIDALPAADQITLEQRSQIEEAEAAYEALTEDQKQYITEAEVNRLTEAADVLKELIAQAEKEQADREAAAAVDQLIRNIGVVTTDSGNAILTAENAYAQLTEDQKAYVENLEILTEARAKYESLLRIDAVERMISDIGKVTLESGSAIEAAENAYAQLSEEEQSRVVNYPILQQARARYEQLKNAQDEEENGGVNGFVNRLYENILGRKADKAGFDSWVKVLTEGTEGGSETVANFVFSREYESRNVSDEEFVRTLYRTILDRDPDAAGLEAWISKLQEGMTRRYVVAGFTNSPEFEKLCLIYGIRKGSFASAEIADQNEMATSFVSRLYTLVLGRKWDRAGLDAWTGQLIRHQTGAGELSKGFFFSQEFTKRTLSNRDFVTICYSTYLNRKPDAAGLNAWVKLLDQGSSKEEILDGFINSPEFGSLCSSYGISR